MHWLTHYAFGSHWVAWLALAVVVAFTLAVRIGGRRFILGLLSRKRNSDKTEKEYWRMHGE